jgi:hypothetical protein
VKAFACLQAGDVDAMWRHVLLGDIIRLPLPAATCVVGVVPFFVPVCARFFALLPWWSWSWRMLCRPTVLVAAVRMLDVGRDGCLSP